MHLELAEQTMKPREFRNSAVMFLSLSLFLFLSLLTILI